ncbi:MAG: hypothetical protein AAF571_12485 [Verrucomicrobiota bacterium]
MKDLIKDGIIASLGTVNRYPALLTDQQDLTALLRQLHPWNTEQPLIRFGPQGDGGYLIPDDLDEIQTCFSPGVSSMSGFEKACAQQGMQVFMADKSVDQPAEDDESFHFIKKFIGATSNEDFMTLSEWVDASIPDDHSELMLQMDIEGCEYEVFLSTPTCLIKRFRIMVVELHLLDQLWNQAFFQLANAAFQKLLQTHSCIHIHPNNRLRPVKKSELVIPPVMEFTFLRNDRFFKNEHRRTFPHPLDSDNMPGPGITLPACWFRNP